MIDGVDSPSVLSPSTRSGGASSLIRFRDGSERLGEPHAYENGMPADRNAIVESLGGGVGIVDYDRDGRADVVLPGGGTFEGDAVVGFPTALRRQTAGGRFADVTDVAGVGGPGRYSHGCAAADYDGDGFADLLITGYGGLRLWHNRGDGTFEDQTVPSGLAADESWSSSAGWGDLNGDGAVDLYVAHYVNWSPEHDPPCYGANGQRDVCPPRSFDGLDDSLFFSNGDGTFREGTSEAGLVPGGKGLGVILADLDGDSDLDVYVANDTTDNFLYLNDGAGHLREQGVVAGAAVDDQGNANGSMGVLVTDFDRNGLPDLFVANYEDELSALYRNQGAANFLYASAETELRRLGTLFVGFGCVAGDYDLDGDEDIAVANGHVVHHPRNAPLLQKALLLECDGEKYRDVSATAGPYFDTPHGGRGLAEADLDGDGSLDLVFVNSREPAAMLLNETEVAGSAVTAVLAGTVSNRDGIGARAVLTTDRGEQSRFVVGGGSYLSTSDRAVHFGVPAGETVRRLTVFWPGGRVDEVPGDKIGAGGGRLTVVEGRFPAAAVTAKP